MESTVKKIEVLGPGCARCHETFRVVRKVVDEAGLSASVEKSDSVGRMVELGALATPAVAVDGHLVVSGRIPRPDEVRRFLGLD